MAILFAILRTILTVLLVILALILILILLILFVPFRYRAMGVNEPGQTEVEAGVTWLLHMLTVEVSYNMSSGTGLAKDIRLFGISLFKVKAWLAERKKSKAEKEKERRRQEKRKKLERMKTEDPERYERLKAEAHARKQEEKRKKEEEERRKREEEERLEAERKEREEAERKKREEAENKKREEAERRKREEERKRLDEERKKQEELQKTVEEEQEYRKTGHKKTGTDNIEEHTASKESFSDKISRIIQKISDRLLTVIQKLLIKLVHLIVRLISVFWHLPGKVISKVSGIDDKVGMLFQKLGQIFGKVESILDFLFDEKTQAVLSLLKKQLGRLIGHIIPRKLNGYVNFGLGDPYMTGRILAGACMFYPLYGKTFRLEPDFDELVFNGRAELKGRIYLFYIVFIALSIILNKNTKYVINYVKSFNKEDSE